MAKDRDRLLLAPRRDVIRATKVALDAAHLAGRPVQVLLFIDGENWFEVVPLAELCERHGVGLDLRTSDEDGRSYLTDLPLEEAWIIHAALSSWWSILAGPHAFRCLEPGAFDNVLRRSRELLLARAAEAAGKAIAALRGRGGGFALPAPDHPLFEDEARAFAMLGKLCDLSHSKSLRAWAHAFATSTVAVAQAGDRAWLRLLLQKLALDEPTREVHALLRELYAEPSRRQLLIADEARAIARHAHGWGLERWRDRLGLQPGPRDSLFPAAGPAPVSPESPQVTVLVPSYRHEQWIERTLASVLAQRDVALTILVVDDASEDRTAELARAVADPRIAVSQNPGNVGLGTSLVAALAGVTTPYVALLNSDDLFHPDRLAECLRLLAENPAVAVVATGYEFIDGQDRILSPENVSDLLDGRQIAELVRWFASNRPASQSGTELFGELLQRNFLATSSNIVCRRSFLQELAPLLQGLNYCVDWCVFLAAAARGRLAQIPRPLLGYRLHGANTVWFRRHSRAGYAAEVARVAAGAIQQRLALATTIDEKLTLATRIVSKDLLANTEVEGHLLFLDTLLEPLGLASQQRDLPQFARAVAQLRRRWERRNAAERLRAEFRAQGPVELWRLPLLRLAHVQAGLLAEELAAARGESAWLRREEATLRGSLAKAADAERSLRRDVAQAEARVARLQTELDAAHELEAELRTTLASTRSEQAASRAEAEQRIGELQQQACAQAARHDAELQQQARAQAGETARMQAALDAASQATEAVEARRAALARQLAQTEDAWQLEVAGLRRSREYRTGDLLWNRVPLVARTAGWLKTGWRRAGNRLSLARLRRWRSSGAAVVAGSETFPHWAHTFVYDDALALRGAGLDPLVFYWTPGDPSRLAPAHASLRRRSVRLHGVTADHRHDLVWWRRRAPDRLRQAVGQIAGATGRPPAEIEQDWDFLRACTFARFVVAAKARWIHTFFFYEQSFFGLVAAALTGLPRAITAYADQVLDDYRFKLVALHVATADLVVATSERARAELLERGGAGHAEKILVKHNGVDPGAFAFVDRAHRAGRPFTAVTVSRLEAKKGLLPLLEALSQARARGLDCRLELIGAADPASPASAAYEASLRQRIGELGLGDAVRMRGFVRHDALPDVLAGSDVFVAPYLETAAGDRDGIPTALLEGMATGLPAVVTDAGALDEAVRDAHEGVVVPQGDPHALASALRRLADDSGLRARLGRAARDRIESTFARAVIDRRLQERIRARLAT